MQFEIYYKHSSCLTVKTCDVHYVDNRSMMCTNIIAVCCEKYIKHTNTLLGEGGRNAEFQNVKPVATLSNRHALKCQFGEESLWKSTKTRPVCVVNELGPSRLGTVSLYCPLRMAV